MTTTTSPTLPTLRRWLPGAALVLLVVLAYLRALHGDFLWDDDLHVTKNPTIVGPLGLKEIWMTARANYFPLVLTNFWLQHAAWGLNPLGYHLVTLACHALVAVLLWRVLLALRVPGAWLGAMLWALHPVQVESVAWIAELKNTQSGIFFLLSILYFVRWLGPEGSRERERVDQPPLAHARGYQAYAFALFFALLALLSKPSTVMLPVALALITWWRRGALHKRDLGLLVPFFALSGVASGWAIWEQRVHSGAMGEEWNQGLLERVAIAGKTTWFYLAKLVWPHPLVFIYPRWDTSARLLDLVPALGVVAALFVLWWRRVPWRTGFIAAGYFVALLFPVLGFFNVFFFRYSFVGDHFQYLASMGPLALIGAGLARLPRRVFSGVAGALILGFGALTWRQSEVYRNNVALWRATVTDNPVATMAWLNLADTLSKEGRHLEAIDSFRHGIALRPDDPDGHSDLGCELVLIGHPTEALPEFETALRLKPANPETHNNLGNALWYLGQHEQAMVEYNRAIALRPDYGEAHNNLGAALAELGRASESLPHFAVALRVNPKHVEAHDNFGNALRKLGRLPEAIAEHEAALRLRPNFAEAHNNLALDLTASGRLPEAIVEFQRVLALRPDLVAASGGLAKALMAVGRHEEAFRQLQTAVQLSPNSAAAHNNLGSILAQSGQNSEAITEFSTAVRLDPNWGAAQTNLATAFAGMGRWSDAIPHFEAAARLLPDAPEAHARLGVALVNANRLEDAVSCFQRALQLNPGSAELHDQFGQVLRALGHYREAQAEFEEAARRQPGQQRSK